MYKPELLLTLDAGPAGARSGTLGAFKKASIQVKMP